MKKLKIKQQNSMILAIIGALKTNILGMGIRECHNIKITRGHYDSLLEFSRKDGKMIRPIDFFMLGYFVGRDYDN